MVQDARRLVRVPIGVDVCAVLEQEISDVEVTVDDGPGERGVENLLHTDVAPLRFPRVHARRGLVIRYGAERRLALRVEPPLHAFEVAHACRMRQIVRYRPDAGEQWKKVCGPVRERVFDGLRRAVAAGAAGLPDRDRAARRRISRDRAKRRYADEPGLKIDPGVAEQPRLALQAADERRQIAVVDRSLICAMTNIFHSPCCRDFAQSPLVEGRG